ncbi:MAG: hypothetical protein LBJ20_05905 [Candidatus Methanoplasma sp.]|nr:hypothetical protein [Candidatus Methanoplasma sp.]
MLGTACLPSPERLPDSTHRMDDLPECRNIGSQIEHGEISKDGRRMELEGENAAVRNKTAADNAVVFCRGNYNLCTILGRKTTPKILYP